MEETMLLLSIAKQRFIKMQNYLASWTNILHFLGSLDSRDMDFYFGLDERATRR